MLGNPDGSLPHAASEAKAVAELLVTKPLVGLQANEREVHARSGQIEILHLAAHGVYEPKNPLFSHIKLAGDRGAGDKGADGLLEVQEVFNLNLKEANLVVLSACNTMIGPLSEGDEIIGLHRAFLHAGTPAIVATLWSINSEATSVLMELFYKGLRNGQTGQTKTTAGALQRAQLAVLSQEKWKTPYFWAGFSLTGDYKGTWQ